MKTNIRQEYVPIDEVLHELDTFFAMNPAPDYITFAGSGEPTLNSGIGRVISFIKKNYPDVPLALLTNGSLLGEKAVREELYSLDLIIPSLDSAVQETFQRMNRPCCEIQCQDILDGIVHFRRESEAALWLEIFIIPGYNDLPHELKALQHAIAKIRPDKVQLNSLDRPGTESFVKVAYRERLQEIREMWGLENSEIIARPQQDHNLRENVLNLGDGVLESIARRPCTAEDLALMFGVSEIDIIALIDELRKKGAVESVMKERGEFFMLVNDERQGKIEVG